MKHYNIKIREQEEEELNPNFTPKKPENITPSKSIGQKETSRYQSTRYAGYGWYTKQEINDLIESNQYWSHIGIKTENGYNFIHGMQAEKPASMKSAEFGVNRDNLFYVHFLEKTMRLAKNGKWIEDDDMFGKKVAIIEIIDPEKHKSKTPPALLNTLNMHEVKNIDPKFYDWIMEFVGEGNIAIDYVKEMSSGKTNKLKFEKEDWVNYNEKGKLNQGAKFRELFNLPITDPGVARPRSINELLTRDLNTFFRKSNEVNRLQTFLIGLGFPDIPFRHNFVNRNYGTLSTSPNYNVSPENIDINIINKSLFKNFDEYMLYVISILKATDEELDIDTENAHEPINVNSPRYANTNQSNWSITRNLEDIPKRLKNMANRYVRTKLYKEGGYFTKFKGYSKGGYDMLCGTDFDIKGEFINDSQYKWTVILKLFKFFKQIDNNKIGQRTPVENFSITRTIDIGDRPNRDYNFLSLENSKNLNDNLYFRGLNGIFNTINQQIDNIDKQEFLSRMSDLELRDITSSRIDERLQILYKKYQKYI